MLKLTDKYKDDIVINKFEEYNILNYKKESINITNIDELGLFRSVVIKNDNILSFSPSKSYELNYFLNNNQIYEIEEYIEGMMINCFFDKKWNISTIISVNHPSIVALFNSMFDRDNWNKLNKLYSYSFIIQHETLKLINKGDKIYLIDIFDKDGDTIKKTSKLKNIYYPEVYKSSLNDIIKHKCHINSNYKCKGIALKNGNKRAKIRNSSFEYFKHVFNNDTIVKIFDFFYLRKNNFIEKYNISIYNLIKKQYHNFTYKIYLSYRNIYIHKTDSLDKYNNLIRNLLIKIHNKYINKLRIKKLFVTKQYVIQLINKHDNYFKFKLLTSLEDFFNLLNQLRF